MANKIVWNVLLFGALIGAALFMYAEKVKQTFVNRYEASNSRQESVYKSRTFPHFLGFCHETIQLRKYVLCAEALPETASKNQQFQYFM